MSKRLLRLFVASACMLALAAPAAAQIYTGRIEVTAVDTTGAILPGVAVDISGPRDATATTDARGQAVFLNLPPGTYTVTARLSGFADYVNRNVPVVAGGTIPLRAALGIAGVTQELEITAETPVIDPKRVATSTNVTYEELQQVPSSRDPWVVLQTVPGIIVDRVNVGGAESGQQSNYQAKGASGGENTWTIDGVPITDMSALGASPTYYDFDMFQELQVTTGGADPQSATPGAALNMVLKTGSNTPRGSARWYYENESMQANNLPSDLRAALGGVTGKGNRIDEYTDYGFELGGPLWRDRLWAWGAFGKTDVTLRTLADTPDQTILENYSFKATGQASQNVRGGFTFYRGEKLKYGRSAGPTRPPATTWDQGGPMNLYNGEVNLVMRDNFFVTARQAYIDGGFFLTPQGGLDTKMIFADDAGIGRFSWYEYRTIRPQWNTQIDGNHFRGRHEFKFGFGYRKADVDSAYTVPGDGIMTFHNGYPNMIAAVTAWNDFTSTTGRYMNAYLSDTLAFDRLTLNLGLRWDRQTSSVRALSQRGNPALPDLLPDLTGNAFDDAVVWNAVTPRIGLTYAITEDRRTIGRLTYAQFSSQMNAGQGGFFSTVGFRGVYFYGVHDANGNQVVDPAELAGRTCTATSTDCSWYGFSISNPGNVSSPIHVVGDYKTPITHEIVVGADRELLPDFGLSANFSWRRFNNSNWRPVVGLRSTNFVQTGVFSTTVDGVGSFSQPFYGILDPAQMPPNRAATEYINREGYWQRFLGFELAATKRLSNRWMGRFAFSVNDHREYFDSPEGIQNPTPTRGSPNKHGGQVMRQTGGSGKSGIFMLLPKYQFILTGMYQAPWGINLATNVNSRQGYAMPYAQTNVPTGGSLLGPLQEVLLVDNVDDFRLPGAATVDLRLGKEFAFNRTRFNVDLDVFNALNSNTVLGRQYDMRLTSRNNVLEIMNPRILRVGLRFGF
jgi:hypothetical protein